MEKRFNIKLFLCCLVVFIFTLFLRVHYINIKSGLHGDEIFSINISNVTQYGWFEDYPNGKTFTGKELKEMTFFNDASFKDTLHDLKELHKDNTDSPHTSLYYGALRLWCNGFTDTDLHSIIWRGLSLNLVFFAFSFIIMYKILRKLFDDNALIPFGLLAAFANTATISNTLFMRPYQLQETIFLLLTYVVINFWFDIEKKKLINVKNLIIAVVSLGLALLSGYMAPSYIGFLGIVLIAKSLKEKQPKNILFLMASLLLAVLFAWGSYLSYFNGFTSYRAVNATKSLAIDSLNFTLQRTLWGYLDNFVFFIYYIPCILIAIFIGLRSAIGKIKPITNPLFYYILACAFLWATVTLIIVPFKVVRYVAPVYPLFAMLYPYIVSGFKYTEKYVYISIFSVIISFYALIAQSAESFETRYPAMPSPFADSAKIENLFLIQKYVYPFTNEPDVPVYFTSRLPLNSMHIIPLLNDNQLCTINSKQLVIPLNLKELYIIIDKDMNADHLFDKYYNVEKDIKTDLPLHIIKLVHK